MGYPLFRQPQRCQALQPARVPPAEGVHGPLVIHRSVFPRKIVFA